MYNQLRIYLKKKFYHTPVIWKLIEIFQGIVYVFDYFYYYKLWGYKNRFSIKEFNIEFASQCNLRCKFCSLDHDKPKYIITVEILERFLSTLLNDKRLQSIEIINLHNGGEILLHPKRIEMLEIIKKYKEIAKSKKIYFPKVYLLTNAMLLREKLSKQIIELDVIDVLGVSLDGGTPNAFEEMRTNATWGEFYKNVKAFCAINQERKHRIQVYEICCLPSNKPLNTSWMHPEFKEILNLLDRYELRRLHNWAGEIEEIYYISKRHKIGCTLLMKQMVLLPNGDITVCCSDLNSKGVIGNILKNDIFSIYNSQNRRRYLYAHLHGKKAELELCKNCETF